MHRPPGQGRNGVTRAQSQTEGGGGVVPPRPGVSRFGRRIFRPKWVKINFVNILFCY